MTPAVMFSKHPMMPLFSVLPPLSQIIYIPHTSIYFPLSVFSSHRCIICAYHCCFSAWVSSSSAWMNSDQIKLALTDSDLPAPPLYIPPHTRNPRVHPPTHSLSLYLRQHLSFYPSFDISSPSVIWGVPLSAEVFQWHKGEPKNPCRPLCIHSQRYWIFSDFAKIKMWPSTEKGSVNFTPPWISQNAAL